MQITDEETINQANNILAAVFESTARVGLSLHDGEFDDDDISKMDAVAFLSDARRFASDLLSALPEPIATLP